ncbi:hydroxyethylthiazole kinase [Persicobacter diffluens]|uniref:Hydroxyethylthiazole kinase n=1 Tax=Persicobacter diffluens TaxID=981 RepID=A0AAN5AN13_9BACT|nr:hydroxyethylthiazole kinase [Persicobacter diffluens]
MCEKHPLNKTLLNIKEQSPLVHNITNYVVMNNTANALLAIGASPVMAHALEEVEDMVSIAAALVINMGTLSEKWVDAMLLAAKRAKALGKPIVFDPVGVGASQFRTETAQKIIQAATPTVIRGNASEIMALAQMANSTKGVDSAHASQDAIAAAQQLSNTLANTIVISGATDYIISGAQISEVSEGSPMMAKVTGMGCTATAIIGACLGVEADAHMAACAAMQIMGLTGQAAAELSLGPGSFQMNFLDQLFQLQDKA